jgi:hypothetical protein
LPFDLKFRLRFLKSGYADDVELRDDELLSEYFPSDGWKYRFEYSDFGLGFKFNEYNVISVPIDSLTGSRVDLPFQNIEKNVMQQQYLTPDKNYRVYLENKGFRGQYGDFIIAADFKKSFQFYDEIKVE